MLRIFFALKNLTASAGFEPTNLGTKGQHATPRPPKPLFIGLMTSKLINRYTKRKIYMMSVWLVVTYACETRTLSIWDINNLLVFERCILRKIFGPIQCKEVWRIRSNKELWKLIKGEDIIKCIF